MAKSKQKLFWMPWYPDDWLTDSQVALCSLAAQGLWMRMLCWMWKQTPQGVLTGKLDELASLTGRTPQEIAPLVAELEYRGVFSRGSAVGYCRADAIVNRRMYEEWRTSAARAAAGRKGGLTTARKAAEKPETSSEDEEEPNQANVKQKPSKGLANHQAKTRANHQANVKQNFPNNHMGENDLQKTQSSKTQAGGQASGQANSQANLKPASNFNYRSRSYSGSVGFSKTVNSAEILSAKESARKANPTPTSVAAILGTSAAAMSSTAYRNQLLGEIAALTRDPQDFMEWFGVAVDILCRHGGSGELEGWIQYAKDCQNPHTRNLKGIGEPLKNPGAFLVSRMIAWGRTKRIGLPPLPAKTTTGATSHVSHHA